MTNPSVEDQWHPDARGELQGELLALGAAVEGRLAALAARISERSWQEERRETIHEYFDLASGRISAILSEVRKTLPLIEELDT